MERLRQGLRDPEGRARKTLERTSTILILAALITAPFAGTTGAVTGWQKAVTYLDLAILFAFTAEYGLRLWIADRPRMYALSFYGLIDLVAILPFFLMLGTDTTALRGIRLLRVAFLWKHKAFSRAWIRLAMALKDSRDEAMIFLVASALILYIASLGIYQFESSAQPEHFGTFAKSFWWSVGLLLDVEYGEIWPVTIGGKAFTAVIALVGIAIVAVPAGMVASALTRIANDPNEVDPEAKRKQGSDEPK